MGSNKLNWTENGTRLSWYREKVRRTWHNHCELDEFGRCLDARRVFVRAGKNFL